MAILVPAQLDDSETGDTEADSSEVVDSAEDPDVESDEAAGKQTEEAIEERIIDEEAILAWYESHPDDYRSQEQIVIEYIELDAATLGGDIAPDEEQLPRNSSWLYLQVLKRTYIWKRNKEEGTRCLRVCVWGGV